MLKIKEEKQSVKCAFCEMHEDEEKMKPVDCKCTKIKKCAKMCEMMVISAVWWFLWEILNDIGICVMIYSIRVMFFSSSSI